MGTETNEMPPHCGFLTDKGIELLLDNEIVIHLVAALYYFGFTNKEWYGELCKNLATAWISIIVTVIVSNKLKFMLKFL